MDTELKALLDNILGKVDEMHDAFLEMKPLLDRYKMLNDAKSFREARKVLKG